VSYQQDLAIASVAEQAARLAGAAILAGSGSIDLSKDIESKIGSRDIVTEVDKRAQDLIQTVILGAFPDHTFLGVRGLTVSVTPCIHHTPHHLPNHHAHHPTHHPPHHPTPHHTHHTHHNPNHHTHHTHHACP
jgi:hypothetical protein